jgi:N-acyl-L-homoserine lactone synthetase
MMTITPPPSVSSVNTTPAIIKVGDSGLYSRVLVFREKKYREHYPAINSAGTPDIHDFASQYFTTLNAEGEVTSCSRLVLDSGPGLPSEKFLAPFLHEYRQRGELVAELGRMAVVDTAPGIAVAHFVQAFNVSRELGIQHIVFVAPTKKSPFFTKFLGARLIVDDIHESFGSHKTFAVYLWHTAAPSNRLQRKLHN